MNLQSGTFYHVFNRGNNGQQIFFSRENYLYFMRKLEKHVTPHANILAFCLMPNHFHLMLELPADSAPGAVSNGVRVMLSSYAQGLNKQLHRTGSLFQQNTRSRDLDDGDEFYGAACFAYIHQNPLRARLVKDLDEWEFSSYRLHLSDHTSGVCAVDRAREVLHLPPEPSRRREYFYRAIPDRYLGLIARS